MELMIQGFATASVNGEGPVTKALACGLPQRVGSFSFHFDDERWVWSAEVSDLHGYGSVPMTPTTEQVLSHKHPEDHDQVATTLAHIRRDRAAFSTRHRIIDTRGRVHHVIVAGDQLRDDIGTVVGTHGFYVDISPVESEVQERITAAIVEVTQNRAVIEQAKGMLSVVYDISGDTAFAVLRWRSQTTNRKLRTLAEQLIVDFRSVNAGPTLPHRSTYDQLLLTGHERIEDVD